MHCDVLEWSVQGFRSFDERQVVPVEDMQVGLWHVAGSNGAGKSSLFEAFYWGIYGHTSRKLRGKTIVNWDAQNLCEVAISIRDLGLFRSSAPNDLRLNGDPVEQATVDKAVPLSSDAFLQSVFFAQFTDAFVDLKPEARMSMYSSVMNLEYWERASDEASDASREVEGGLQELRERIAALASRIETLESTSYKEDIECWEKGQQEKVNAASGRLRTTQDQLKVATRKLEKLPTTEERDGYLREAERAASTSESLTRDMRSIEKQLREAEAIKGPRKCPICGSLMTEKHAKVEMKNLRELLQQKQEKQREVTNQHDKALRAVAKLNKDYVARLDCEKEVAVCEQVIREAQRELKLLESESNPYVEKERERVARLQEAGDGLKVARERLGDGELLLNSVRYWVRGYKDLRLSLIEESLAQLNVEVNERVYQLGLQGWEIKFDVERETKSKTIKRGFMCMVKAPSSPDLVPWEVWSGGESQRLRLAVSMGMSNLIAERTGVYCNIEMWDEPSTWLNDLGIQSLLEALADRARQQNKVIFLADHRALGFGDFAGTIHVEKTKCGSRLEIT